MIYFLLDACAVKNLFDDPNDPKLLFLALAKSRGKSMLLIPSFPIFRHSEVKKLRHPLIGIFNGKNRPRQKTNIRKSLSRKFGAGIDKKIVYQPNPK